MILDCGHEPSKHEDFTTGYGVDKYGKKHCYDCCAKNDLKNMLETGRATLYLVNNNKERAVTNWPGSLRFKAHVRSGSHNWTGKRYDCWFWVDNVEWHGVQYGDNTQICHCKRTKRVK